MKTKFGKRGEGPKEFMANRQTGNPPLTINVQTKNIIVNSLNKVSFFSKDAKFKNEQKVGAFTDRFIPLGKGFAAQTFPTAKSYIPSIIIIKSCQLQKRIEEEL